MAEYIEREATIKLLRSLGSRDYRREKGTIQEAIKIVSFPEYTPSADVAPVRRGRWEKQRGIYSCSECGMTCPYDVQADVIEYWACNYCPNCGADMRKEKNDGGL